MSNANTFDRQTGNLILRDAWDGLHRSNGPTRKRTAHRAPRSSTRGTGVYLAKTSTGGIPAMSTSNVAGSGTVDLYYISTANTLTLKVGSDGNTVTKTAYNISTWTIGANKWIQIKQEMLSGKFIVDYEDCNA